MTELQRLQDRGLEALGQGAFHRTVDVDLEMGQFFHVRENVGQRGHACALDDDFLKAGKLAERIRQRSLKAGLV